MSDSTTTWSIEVEDRRGGMWVMLMKNGSDDGEHWMPLDVTDASIMTTVGNWMEIRGLKDDEELKSRLIAEIMAEREARRHR